MYSPRTTSKDLNISVPKTSLRLSNGNQRSFVLMKEEFQNREETMDFNWSSHGLNASGSVHTETDFHPQISTSLMRYRSAPSSLLANFVHGEGCEDFLPCPSSPEPENVLARFLSCDSSCLTSESRDLQSHASPDLHEMEAKSATNPRNPTAKEEINKRRNLMSMLEGEREVVQQNGFSGSHILYHQAQNPCSTAIEGSYRINSLPMDLQVKNNSGPSLIRHSSSPAGLFSHSTVENGYSMIRPMNNFKAGNSSNGETVATSRLKKQSRFSRQDSPTGLKSQVSEMGSESMGASSSDDGSLGNSNGGRCFIPGFPWDNSPIVSENLTGLQGPELAYARKRLKDINGKMFSGFNSSESQNGEIGNPGPGLSHHFSLPKTSAEMAAMEKLLQLQDAVPCKIRAKRGHATHPRSIAERVRRTRISERIRKLQELVPNMDKQTNTADMLELAVEYIKDLQKQVKTLSDNRTRCTCSSK